MTDTRTDALPCPLCGRQATVAQIKAGIEWWSVECEAERGDGCGLNIARSTQASAIAAWNARPSTPPSDDALAAGVVQLWDTTWPEAAKAQIQTLLAQLAEAQAEIKGCHSDIDRQMTIANEYVNSCLALEKQLAEREATIARMAEALGKIERDECDPFAGDPFEWPCTIARIGLGKHPHPNGESTP